MLPCRVAISGYHSDLYAERLGKWRLITFESVVRSGEVAIEHLWMNYPEPQALHDTRYLGSSWRERQRIHRQQRRWIARLKARPPLERQAMLECIRESFGAITTPLV